MGGPTDPTLEEMLDDAVDLHERLGRGSFLYIITASLLRNALLHHDAGLREEAIQVLQKRYEGMVRKGFASRGGLYMELCDGENAPRLFYVCEWPEEYMGMRCTPVPFDLEARSRVN